MMPHAAASGIIPAFRLLFMTPDSRGNLEVRGDLPHAEFLGCIAAMMRGGGEAAAPDYWNFMAGLGGGRTLGTMLEECFFEVAGDGADSATCEFMQNQADAVCEAVFAMAASVDPAELPPPTRVFISPEGRPERKRYGIDILVSGGAFTFSGGRFAPVKLGSIRAAGKFFGYEGPRRQFRDALADFSLGRSNVPLLVSSLPGHGKTQFAISHALEHPELTLILPDPCVLEKGLPGLFGRLERRSGRRFVVFFDDIVPDEVDFYEFRTRVGGAFAPPDNVMLILSSNYPFPPSILSRGRSVSFPTFDEVKCVEMVADFLASCGMKHPNENLTLLIAADYIEEFGQKKFPELSPRTLVRYLARYEHDAVKRRTMMQLAGGELITRPDAQLFYEFNIQLMRRLYGDGHIESLLKEKLRNLGS